MARQVIRAGLLKLFPVMDITKLMPFPAPQIIN